MPHTPGPWEFIGPSCVRIKSVELHPGNADDARLIAAAPDLLEVLEDIMDTEFAGGPQGKRARRAIAKAKGEDHAI